jgi:hypothetical protein
MDLNELLHAHQVSVMKASASGDDKGRDDHFAKVALYAERIRGLRDVREQGGSANRLASPETIIYGSYSGETLEEPAPATVASWEDEGGALDPPELPVPEGIVTSLHRSYHVGPYVYQDLGLAVAEHKRQSAAADDVSHP